MINFYYLVSLTSIIFYDVLNSNLKLKSIKKNKNYTRVKNRRRDLDVDLVLSHIK